MPGNEATCARYICDRALALSLDVGSFPPWRVRYVHVLVNLAVRFHVKQVSAVVTSRILNPVVAGRVRWLSFFLSFCFLSHFFFSLSFSFLFFSLFLFFLSFLVVVVVFDSFAVVMFFSNKKCVRARL